MRLRTETVDRPLGPLSDAVGGPDDGLLSQLDNLRPAARGSDQIRHEVVRQPARAFASVTDAISGAVHIRQRPVGDDAAGDAAALERLVTLSAAGTVTVRTLDTLSTVYSFSVPGADAESWMELAPAGPYGVLAVSGPEGGIGTYLLGDDAERGLGGVPVVGVKHVPDTSGTTSFDYDNVTGTPDIGFVAGTYEFRAALAFKDGSYGPLSAAWTFNTPTPLPDAEEQRYEVVLAPEYEPDAYWKDRTLGVAVFVSAAAYGLDDDTELSGAAARYAQRENAQQRAEARASDGTPTLGTTFHEVAVVEWGETYTFSESLDDIYAGPTSADLDLEGDLSYGTYTAATVRSFNRNVLLGAAAIAYPGPRLATDYEARAAVGNGGPLVNVRIGVVLDTVNGERRAYGPVQQASTDWNGADITEVLIAERIADVLAGYHDRRASALEVYVETDANLWYLAGTFALEAARVGNYSTYKPNAPAASRPITVPPHTVEPLFTADKFVNEADYDPQRVVISEAFRPSRFKAQRFIYLGNGPSDRVSAFAIQAQPVTEGEFGNYPVVVFCQQSVWLIKGDGSLAAVGTTPALTSEGVASSKMVATASSAVYASTSVGVRVFAPLPVRESRAGDVVNLSNPIRRMLGEVVAMATSTSGGSTEVWFATVQGVYCYCLSARRWYHRPIARVAFFADRGTLYGIDPDGAIHQEDSADLPVNVAAVLHPVALGDPGADKRLHRAAVWQEPPLDQLVLAISETVTSYEAGGPLISEEERDGAVFIAPVDGNIARFAKGSARAPQIALLGTGTTGQSVSGITLEVESRYGGVLAPAQRAARHGV